jgi:hypothetical protein
VDVLKLNVESLEAENKIEELSQKKAEKTLARDRSREIQLVKEIVIPHGLRASLPPDILLISLRMIDETLKGVNFSLEECVALAESVIWMKYWGGNLTIYRVVRPAIINWIFETLFQDLRDGYAEAMIKGYEGTFNDFLSYIFLHMSPSEQAIISSFAYRKTN